jgi:hypothetical protein
MAFDVWAVFPGVLAQMGFNNTEIDRIMDEADAAPDEGEEEKLRRRYVVEDKDKLAKLEEMWLGEGEATIGMDSQSSTEGFKWDSELAEESWEL